MEHAIHACDKLFNKSNDLNMSGEQKFPKVWKQIRDGRQ